MAGKHTVVWRLHAVDIGSNRQRFVHANTSIVMCLTCFTAAALGNLISDIAGLGFVVQTLREALTDLNPVILKKNKHFNEGMLVVSDTSR